MKNFEFLNNLNRLSFILNEFTRNIDLSSSFEILNIIKKIELGISVMKDVFKSIQESINQIEFTTYLNEMMTNQLDTYDTIKSIELKGKIQTFQNIINEDIIRESHNRALEAFSLSSFPFFCDYMENYQFDGKNYIQNLRNLQKAVQYSESTLTPRIDNSVFDFKFEKNMPFYKWSSDMNPFEVFSFLDGNETSLYADIAVSKYEIVKFNHIYLVVSFSDSNKLNNELGKILSSFYVELMYDNNSLFKVNNKIFSIKSNYIMDNHKLVLKYKYGCNDKNDNCNSNYSYRKLKTSYPKLSPYGLWKIRLVGEPNDFKRLRIFIQQNIKYDLSIFLCCSGTHVKNMKLKTCNHNDLYVLFLN